MPPPKITGHKLFIWATYHGYKGKFDIQKVLRFVREEKKLKVSQTGDDSFSFD